MSVSRRDFLKKSATVSALSAAALMGVNRINAEGASEELETEPVVAPTKGDRKAPAFKVQDPYPLGPDKTKYTLLTDKYVSVTKVNGKEMLQIDPKGLTFLANAAMKDVSFLLRPAHLEQVAAILSDPEASDNDRYVATTMLRNAEVAAQFRLPICQDTGTATIFAKKGQRVLVAGSDEHFLSAGVYKTYTEEDLRYSQTIPLDMYEEINNGVNLPAQIDVMATTGMEYKFLFVAKGGGSANKTMLFQETKAVLNPASLEKFLVEKMKSLGTAACPPYHLAFVVGGTSAEACLKTVKLASTKYLDTLPTSGNKAGQAFRDLELEKKLLQAAYKCGYGAQFGGKYFALDVRVIRLPRHGASCPIGMGVSCSADRNVKAKIDRNGIWLEELERNPGRFLPISARMKTDDGVKIDVNAPMKEVLAQISKYPVGTRLSLSGTVIVARDIAHTKFKERLDKGLGLPEYLTKHPIYYAGPAKTPQGYASGSFGPTTAGRMDSYVELLQANGGSMIMIAKGNRSKQVTDACKKNGGFYLGSIGGPAAILAKENIRKVECLDYPELGMESVWKIEVVDFPAFILVDDKGNDLYKKITG
ncbi:fumarate hydratase [Geomonas sp. RF6]|uniref:fumarate hydratase n=1 Tax=Geomonas sp. RF6 TaxID=2897342 RepID=UPI001E316180|nr:fumarate hydratase [Geomonas sp. RF6]UFS69025.1 fumarate hydratase [Geomonas sp. RF6]